MSYTQWGKDEVCLELVNFMGHFFGVSMSTTDRNGNCSNYLLTRSGRHTHKPLMDEDLSHITGEQPRPTEILAESEKNI